MADRFDAKDCPFCGSDEISYGYSFPPMVGVVECHACEAILTAPTEAEAVAAWNAQAPTLIAQKESA